MQRTYKIHSKNIRNSYILTIVGVTKAGDDVVASVDGGCAVFSATPAVDTDYSPWLNTKLKSQVYEVLSTTTVRNKPYVDLRVCHNAMIT